MGRAGRQQKIDGAPVLHEATVSIEQHGRRPFTRPASGTLLLTPDELLVVFGPPAAPEVFMRQHRQELAMVRHPTPRGGEKVELDATDGQHATLRFARSDAAGALALAGWFAGLPVSG
jgi:hypothetical protein